MAHGYTFLRAKAGKTSAGPFDSTDADMILVATGASGIGSAPIDNAENDYELISQRSGTAACAIYICRHPNTREDHVVSDPSLANFGSVSVLCFSGFAEVIDSIQGVTTGSFAGIQADNTLESTAAFQLGISVMAVNGTTPAPDYGIEIDDGFVLDPDALMPSVIGVNYGVGVAYRTDVALAEFNPFWSLPSFNATGCSTILLLFDVNEAEDDGIELTGVSATGAVGTLGVSVAVGLTGVSATGSVGTLGVSTDMTIGLTGIETVGSVGTLTPSVSSGEAVVELTGVSAVGAVGDLSPNSNNLGSGGEPPVGNPARDLKLEACRREAKKEEEIEAGILAIILKATGQDRERIVKDERSISDIVLAGLSPDFQRCALEDRRSRAARRKRIAELLAGVKDDE